MGKSKDVLICELQYALGKAEQALKNIRCNEGVKIKCITATEYVNKYFKIIKRATIGSNK